MRPITCSSICASSTSRKAMVGGMGEKCITEMSKNYPQFTQVYSNPEQARVKAYAYHTHLRGTTNQQRENYLGFHQTETYPRGITYDSRNGLCSDKRSSSQHTIQPADRQVQPLACVLTHGVKDRIRTCAPRRYPLSKEVTTQNVPIFSSELKGRRHLVCERSPWPSRNEYSILTLTLCPEKETNHIV